MLHIQTGDIITSTQFEEDNLSSETREDSKSDDKSGEKSDDNSIMPYYLSKKKLMCWILATSQMMVLCIRI